MKKLRATMAAIFLLGGIYAIPAAHAAAPDEFNIIPLDYTGFVLSPEGRIDEEGNSFVLVHEAPETKWTFSSYTFPIDADIMKKLQFSYQYKVTDVVVGENAWNAARLFVNFFDSDGKQINDWPSPGFWKGTADWKTGKWTLDITKGAAKGTLSVGFDSSSGEFKMKDLAIYALDSQKNKVKPLAVE